MMNNVVLEPDRPTGVSDSELLEAVKQSVSGISLNKVLLIPPDYTRMHSGAGKITAMYYKLLKETCEIDIMPALGTHEPMSEWECSRFFGDEIPYSAVIKHNWRTDIEKIGEVPAGFVSEVSGGLVTTAIDVEVNRRLLDKSYDLIISIGQVVPHEVVGMANYSKNILVGCGGSSMINSSHMLGAFYGLERIMGKDFSPVRRVFDYAEEHFLTDIPLMYALTVTTADEDGAVIIHGVYMGRDRELFERAVKLSQQKNLIFVEKPLKKVVVNLDETEFKSTWVGNKAVYRTRMAIMDNGELIVLAPGVKKFGEDSVNDLLIRKYGYAGRVNVLKLCDENTDLRANLSVAAHLIHGSSDGRFSITYCTGKLTKEEVESVNFNYMPIEEALKIYDPSKLKDGFNTLDSGEEIYYISKPALGLWAEKARFEI